MKSDKSDENKVSSTEKQPENKCGETHKSAFISLFCRLLKWWRNFLILVILLCIAGIPLSLFLINPTYTVRSAIKVETAQENLLTGQMEKGVSDNFMNTQAAIITSEPIREKVVDKLFDRKLNFLKEGPFDPMDFLIEQLRGEKIYDTPEQILSKAAADGVILAAPAKNTDLIYVTMVCENSSEAQQIVDAFVESYMAIEVVSMLQNQENKLKVLKDEKDRIEEKNRNYRRNIMEFAREFGRKELTPRQEMKLERISMLYGKVTEYEAVILELQAKIKVLKKRIEVLEALNIVTDPNETKYVADPDDPGRTEYINYDETVVSLASEIASYKRMLRETSIESDPNDVKLKRMNKALAQLQSEFDARKKEVGKIYDSKKERQFLWKGKQELIDARAALENAQAELELNKNTKLQFELLLKDEDVETRDVGRVQLAIQEKEDVLRLQEEQFEVIVRRIQQLEMDQKRPQRVTVAYNADVVEKKDSRVRTILSLAGAIIVSLILLWMQREIRKCIC